MREDLPLQVQVTTLQPINRKTQGNNNIRVY